MGMTPCSWSGSSRASEAAGTDGSSRHLCSSLLCLFIESFILIHVHSQCSCSRFPRFHEGMLACLRARGSCWAPAPPPALA